MKKIMLCALLALSLPVQSGCVPFNPPYSFILSIAHTLTPNQQDRNAAKALLCLAATTLIVKMIAQR